MTTRAEIVAEARDWLGTPWRHQGQSKGRGADCLGFVVGVGRAFGLIDYVGAYPRRPDPGLMLIGLREQLDELTCWKEAQEADILHMQVAGEAVHLGILTERWRIVHAYFPIGKIVEHRIDDKWQRRIVRAFSFRGLS